jgi:uracil-DNA glycosylase
MNKQARLDQIRADIHTKNICPDLAKTAKQLVFGSGNIHADIVFIGEAPGKKEDETGEPFVGAAGKFLDLMLNSIHLQRSNIYITNIVKYRPPENRDPSPVEKQAFLPYLYQQLAVINPKVVVTLGRHSTSCFLPSQQIGDIHGKPQEIVVVVNGREVKYLILPLYHPAAALYNGKLRQTLLDDFAIIPQFL